MLPIYQACGTQYGIPWQVLASINRIETAFGTNLNVSTAGALGWMQFMPATWEMYEVATTPPETVRGVTVADNGLRLQLDRTQLPVTEDELKFRVLGTDGAPVTQFDVEHTKRMHLIVVRRDLTGFQHLHPVMQDDGTWSTPIELTEAGSYRVFADFNHDGESVTLGTDLAVDGRAEIPGRSRAADGGRNGLWL